MQTLATPGPAGASGDPGEDFSAEKKRLHDARRAVLKILDDFDAGREQLPATKQAVLDILEDLGMEKERLEATQAALRVSLREKEVLLKEVHHRVKNNLQVISSLMSLQARHYTDPVARAMFIESQNRVHSIALVQEKLYQSPDLSHVDFDDYVRALVANLLHAKNAGAGAGNVECLVDVRGTRLTVEHAIPCGLIVNELVTNALEHAFPDGRAGAIRVAMGRAGAGVLELRVGDDGVGLPAALDPRRTGSLGLDLVFTFAEQLHAEVTVDRSGGTAFCFRFADEGSA